MNGKTADLRSSLLQRVIDGIFMAKEDEDALRALIEEDVTGIRHEISATANVQFRSTMERLGFTPEATATALAQVPTLVAKDRGAYAAQLQQGGMSVPLARAVALVCDRDLGLMREVVDVLREELLETAMDRLGYYQYDGMSAAKSVTDVSTNFHDPVALVGALASGTWSDELGVGWRRVLRNHTLHFFEVLWLRDIAKRHARCVRAGWGAVHDRLTIEGVVKRATTRLAWRPRQAA